MQRDISRSAEIFNVPRGHQLQVFFHPHLRVILVHFIHDARAMRGCAPPRVVSSLPSFPLFSFSIRNDALFFFSLSLSLSLPRVLSRKTERRRPGAVGCEGASAPRALVPHEALVFVVVFFPKRWDIYYYCDDGTNQIKEGLLDFFSSQAPDPTLFALSINSLFFDWFERSPKDGFFCGGGGHFRLKFLFSSKSRKNSKKKPITHTHKNR